MSPKELYEWAKMYNIEDLPITYPEYGNEDLLKEATKYKAILNPAQTQEHIIIQ